MLDAAELVKRIQEMRDGGYLSDPILRDAVLKMEESDDRFDWVGVYLFEPKKNRLWLHNYVGAPTEHARIEVGEGVCGTAVAEGENQRIDDVSELDNYLACNPDVKSEMVVLIRAGSEVLGQIDIDSDQAETFTDDDEGTVQAVADKLAEVLMAERD